MPELTWRQAIEQVLRESSEPLHYEEITERIIADALRVNTGATPAATVSAHISSSIKNIGAASPFVRVARGTYTLRDKSANAGDLSNELAETPMLDEPEKQYGVVSSFGMFWRRDGIEWQAMPKILGMQQIGALPVDFCKQLGIYLLYDGREVIYVGRSTDRPLGKRLYEHTLDRLSTRWDRFSWFGLLPVSAQGEIGDLPAHYESSLLIPALEAILIEAVEPRQNRKRGDDLSAAEFVQKIDPEIEKRQIKARFEAALNKL